jgi:hypothetical protein
MADPSEERWCERAQVTRKVMAKWRARAIRRRWIGGGEFDPVSGAVPAAGKSEKRESVGSAVLLMVRARQEESLAPI